LFIERSLGKSSMIPVISWSNDLSVRLRIFPFFRTFNRIVFPWIVSVVCAFCGLVCVRGIVIMIWNWAK